MTMLKWTLQKVKFLGLVLPLVCSTPVWSMEHSASSEYGAVACDEHKLTEDGKVREDSSPALPAQSGSGNSAIGFIY